MSIPRVHDGFRNFVLCVSALLLASAAGAVTAAAGQTSIRVRGTITGLEANVLSVRAQDG